jgi:hypothetical protein
LNSRNVALLDNERLISQLCSLERQTSRAGRDQINHAPGQHDDLVNAAAGALSLARPSPAYDDDIGVSVVRLDGYPNGRYYPIIAGRLL